MHNPAAAALLPAGLMDLLPPAAAFEAQTVERLMALFASFGYERVKPPLIEFEETMLAGSGQALAAETFRVMDPLAQRLLALRPDMTMQVARIAATRLAHQPRPLRLGYAGQVLRVRGSQLRPERQFGQVGAEIVGTTSPAADVEVIVMATSALGELGLVNLSVDLGLPTLVPTLVTGEDGTSNLDPATAERLRLALDRKDIAAISELAPQLNPAAGRMLPQLVAIAGPVDRTLPVLCALDLPPRAAAERAGLIAVIERLRVAAPELSLTLDPVESRGFEYHTGVTYAVFAAAAPYEIGRGGRYGTFGGEEPATGITLFMDGVLRALPRPERPARLLLPETTPAATAAALRRDGWVTVMMLDTEQDPETEAARLGCTHVYNETAKQPVPVAATGNGVKE